MSFINGHFNDLGNGFQEMVIFRGFTWEEQYGSMQTVWY